LLNVQGNAGLRGQALITLEDVVRWGNQAQRRIATETKWYRIEATAGTTSGTKYYDFPVDLISLEDLYNDGLPLVVVTVRDLDRMNSYWRQDGIGTPLYYYRRGYNGYALHPTPDTTDVDILTLRYAALPTAISDADDFFFVPTALEEAIECFCNLRAAIKDATGEGRDRVGIFAREWEKWEAVIQSFVRSAAEGQILVVGADNNPPGVDYPDVFDRGLVT